MPAKEAPITGKVRKKSSSGHTTIGRRRGVQGATTEINHYGELGTETSTFGQGDLKGGAVAEGAGEVPSTDGGSTAAAAAPPAPGAEVAAGKLSAKSDQTRRSSGSRHPGLKPRARS